MRRLPGRILWCLMLPLVLLAAQVRTEVDKKEVVRGDTVTFSITAEGENVEFPVLKEIDGFPILGASQRSNISIINGETTRSVTKSYTFAPMRDVTIPSLVVKVDGNVYRTDPIAIRVTDRPVQTTQEREAILEISTDRERVHVGEPVKLEITIRYLRRANFVQVDLETPEFANFWIKKLGDVEKTIDGEYIVEKQRYLIFPQKAGEYTLGPLTAKIAKRVRVKPPIADPFFDDDFFNGFFARLQWTRIASNSVKLHVDPLPGNVDLYGKFDIRAGVDKNVTDVDQPVRLTIEIEGEGNIDDIEKFEPSIPDAVVYSDEPVVKEWVRDGRYGGTFRQTVTIVSDHDFTIPSLVLRYYDKYENRVVEKKTAPIKIHVRGGRQVAASRSNVSPSEKSAALSQASSRKEELIQTYNASGSKMGWVYLLIGLLLGGGGVYAAGRLKKSMAFGKKSDTADLIRRTRDERKLFELLLPYANESIEIKEALEKLEENLYRKKRHKIDRKLLADIVEELEEEREDYIE